MLCVDIRSSEASCRDAASNTVLQLGFEGRGVLGRALFAWSYKNEGTMCHAMCLVSRYVTKYNPIPQ